jgi:hypothetical protein
LLGDALHKIRCALDHIVYALAVRQTGQDPPEDDSLLMFPICSEPKYWNNPKIQRRIACLNEPTRAAIERVQPYNRVKGQWFAPLWWLAQLNDVDKHRLPHVTVVAAHADTVAINAEPGMFEACGMRGRSSTVHHCSGSYSPNRTDICMWISRRPARWSSS